MSEKLSQAPERQQETIDTSAEAEKNLQRLQEAAKNAPEHSVDAIEASLAKAKLEAVSGREVTIGERETGHQTDSPGLQKELKAESYKKTMQRVQHNLNKPERGLSRIVHQPVVDKVSTALGTTIARPSGILGGSACALIGSIGLVYFSRHYGFTYNYLFFTVLFVSGFFAGLVFEAAIKAAHKR